MPTNSVSDEFCKSRNGSKAEPRDASTSVPDRKVAGHRGHILASANAAHQISGFATNLKKREAAEETVTGAKTAAQPRRNGGSTKLTPDDLQFARKDTHGRVEPLRILSRSQMTWLRRGERIGRALRNALGLG